MQIAEKHFKPEYRAPRVIFLEMAQNIDLCITSAESGGIDDVDYEDLIL